MRRRPSPALSSRLFPLLRSLSGALALTAVGAKAASAPPGDIDVLTPLVISASRTPQPPENSAASIRLLDAEALRASPTLTLDGTLRSVPGFTLFRRSDSFTANPTAQGVSLRGLGPSGASRSLVLLDGVPLNDPFGGWVAWTKVPREGLGRVEIVPGGGATAWGNAALGGVVQLFTPLRTSLDLAAPDITAAGASGTATRTGTLRARPSLQFAAIVGDYGTRSAEISATIPTSHGAIQILGRDFATDGFSLVAPERRGPIDLAAWSRHRWLTLRAKHDFSGGFELLATVRAFEEKRGNGTPYQHNGSREKFASLALAGPTLTTFTWNAVAYAQTQGFASTFSGVNAARTAETPASDQFAVPSVSFGGAWTGHWTHSADGHTTFGADARSVRGETRELFTFTNGNFTRVRVAGGKQEVGGLFALHEQRLTSTWRANIGGRVDAWEEKDGHRWETDRTTGAVFRNDHYADRDGHSFSPSAGLVWTPAADWRLRANGQKSFRRPTLNELYRPFRVGPNVTEANAALATERATSAEVGAEWSLFALPDRAGHGGANATQGATNSTANGSTASSDRAAPSGSTSAGATSSSSTARPALTLGVTAFWNDLRDEVGNVTLARGPGTFSLFGTIAAGGVGRQRLNLDRVRVQGLELSARWSATRDIQFSADYLYNDATVRRARIAPALVGNRVAQVARHSGSVAATWHAPGNITLVPRARWIGRQFEDDENQLRLGEVVIGDLSVSRPLTPQLTVFVTAENLGNARIETGRTADGVVNLGTPRLVLIGLRGHW